MKKYTVIKRLLAMTLVLAMCFALAACSGGENPDNSQPGSNNSQPGGEQTNAPAEPNGYAINYKGKTDYESIAEQLRSDTTLDLNGLDSEMFKITGYAQGYFFDDAWFGSLGQMVNSGEQVILASGSGQFPFNFGGLPRTSAETDIHVGGVDSLTQEFADLLNGGVYDFCSGSHPSMIAPALALTLRALEGDKLVDADGNAAEIPMSHVVVNSADELAEVLAEDTAGNYAYNAGVVSYLMSADYNAFMNAVANADWAQIKSTKSAHSGDTKATLSKEWKIGLLQNDTTSDEALAYQAYLSEMAKDMGFSIAFSDSTDGNATNEVNQIQTWASAGFDAVICMSAGSIYDMASTCQDNGMTFIGYAAHPVEDDLIDLQTLDSYIGSVGPTKFNEAEAGYRMAKYYIDNGYTDFAIFGGSIAFGAEQHAYRVGGMIAAMVEKETGVPNTDFN